ncbi:Rpn family recombination-promoting nuclease/putative transposase [Pantoea cypripedii]
MTIAQQLEMKGFVIGFVIGFKRGMWIGEQKGKRQVARNMLLNGMDRITVMQMTGLTEDDLSQIDH